METSSRQKMNIKVDTGSDGNLMPLNIFKILFLKALVEQFAKCR